MAQTMRIDITSDVRCPFCLLGVKQLNNAIEKYNTSHPTASIRPEIKVLPFQLDPTIGPEPLEKKEVMRRKFGDRAEGLGEMMKRKIMDEGYPEPVDGTTSSSHTAQRLQAYTLDNHPEKQLALYNDILESYHIRGIYPAHVPTLAQIAVKHGIWPTEADAARWLESEEYGDVVEEGYSVARGMGIGGVPFFVFEGKYAASGAMGTGEFVKLLEEIVKRKGTGEE